MIALTSLRRCVVILTIKPTQVYRMKINSSPGFSRVSFLDKASNGFNELCWCFCLYLFISIVDLRYFKRLWVPLVFSHTSLSLLCSLLLPQNSMNRIAVSTPNLMKFRNGFCKQTSWSLIQLVYQQSPRRANFISIHFLRINWIGGIGSLNQRPQH